MSKPVHIKAHVLEDPIVLDSISAFNRVKLERNIKGNITGGMAVQSYLPASFYRGTVDLDFDFLWGGSTEEFKDLMQPAIRYLTEKGYFTEGFIRKGFTFDNYLSSQNDSFMMQHARRSTESFKRNRDNLERELHNQRTVRRSGVDYTVLSPEDLIFHKASRINNFMKNFEAEVPKNVSHDSVKEIAEELRKKIVSEVSQTGLPSNPTDVAQLRVHFDVYDMKALTHFTGISLPYLGEIIDGLTDESKRSRIEAIIDRVLTD